MEEVLILESDKDCASAILNILGESNYNFTFNDTNLVNNLNHYKNTEYKFIFFNELFLSDCNFSLDLFSPNAVKVLIFDKIDYQKVINIYQKNVDFHLVKPIFTDQLKFMLSLFSPNQPEPENYYQLP